MQYPSREGLPAVAPAWASIANGRPNEMGKSAASISLTVRRGTVDQMSRRRPAADRIDRGRGPRRAGAALLIVAVVAGVAGHYALPRILEWLLFAVLVWGGVTLLLRDGAWLRRSREPYFRSFDDRS